ncbi:MULTISPECIES: DUF6530 family protein [Peribacillus]|uniref:DUF6530 family protein n=1 Tax=Peribacillus frigoritolerans TaxID=450367 RepID=UPI003D9FF1DD
MNKDEYKYKSIITVENYDKVDGKAAYGKEIESLSTGMLQGKSPRTGDIVGKIVMTDDSAQEIKLSATRILDLAILILSTNLYFRDAYKFEKLYDPENQIVTALGLQGNKMQLEIDTKNENLDKDIQYFYDMLQSDGEILGERFRIINNIMKEMGYR